MFNAALDGSPCLSLALFLMGMLTSGVAIVCCGLMRRHWKEPVTLAKLLRAYCVMMVLTAASILLAVHFCPTRFARPDGTEIIIK